MINVGIVGGAGYTGGELLRILIHHPHVEIKFAHSNSSAGNPVHAAHSDLLGETELLFTDQLSTEIDVLIMCLGHGDAAKFLSAHPEYLSLKIIDLSTDFRHKREENDFVYGLPELNKTSIKSAQHIANPGCFATCIQLAVLPLASEKKLPEVHVSAITGSTGAGQKPTATSHFSWRNNNMSVYKAFEHQHLKEIGESITQLQPGFEEEINFVPFRGDFARGIIASVYIESDLSEEKANQLFQSFYQDHPFVHVVDENPHLKQVVNTNKVLLYVKKYGKKLHIISLIDNLTKGASGQAVQNLNLMFGLDETTGLKLKTVAF